LIRTWLYRVLMTLGFMIMLSSWPIAWFVPIDIRTGERFIMLAILFAGVIIVVMAAGIRPENKEDDH